MVSRLLRLSTALALSVGEITSMSELNAAFDAEDASATTKLGFLSRGNYEAVHSILPKEVKAGGKLEVVIFDGLDKLEAAVLDGSVVAGLSTSRPLNANNTLVEFGAGLVTPRASFFAAGNDGKSMKEAVDAAIVRVISSGKYQEIEAKYYRTHNFETVAAFSCSSNPDYFPFPTATAGDLLEDMLDNNVLKVASLGSKDHTPANWGYQGDYTKDTPTGFWPEYEDAIYTELFKEYKGKNGKPITVQRVWNSSSAGVMDIVKDSKAHMTAPYWTIPAFYQGKARQYTLALGCSTLGTEQWFFTKRAVTEVQEPETKVVIEKEEITSTWAIVGIVVAVVLAVGAVVVIAMLIRREKKGEPVFSPLLDHVAPEAEGQPLQP